MAAMADGSIAIRDNRAIHLFDQNLENQLVIGEGLDYIYNCVMLL